MARTAEQKFKAWLNDYIRKENKSPTAIADSAGIKRTTLSKIRHTGRRVFLDELVDIALSEGVSIQEILDYPDRPAI